MFLIGFLFNAAIVVRFFFPAPLVFVVALVFCLAMALIGRADTPAAAPDTGAIAR